MGFLGKTQKQDKKLNDSRGLSVQGKYLSIFRRKWATINAYVKAGRYTFPINTTLRAQWRRANEIQIKQKKIIKARTKINKFWTALRTVKAQENPALLYVKSGNEICNIFLKSQDVFQ